MLLQVNEEHNLNSLGHLSLTFIYFRQPCYVAAGLDHVHAWNKQKTSKYLQNVKSYRDKSMWDQCVGSNRRSGHSSCPSNLTPICPGYSITYILGIFPFKTSVLDPKTLTEVLFLENLVKLRGKRKQNLLLVWQSNLCVS